MVILQCELLIKFHQRVNHPLNPIKPPFSYGFPMVLFSFPSHLNSPSEIWPGSHLLPNLRWGFPPLENWPVEASPDLRQTYHIAVYICIYVYIYICIYDMKYVYIMIIITIFYYYYYYYYCMYIHTYVRTYIRTHIRTYVRTYIQLHTYIHTSHGHIKFQVCLFPLLLFFLPIKDLESYGGRPRGYQKKPEVAQFCGEIP